MVSVLVQKPVGSRPEKGPHFSLSLKARKGCVPAPPSGWGSSLSLSLLFYSGLHLTGQGPPCWGGPPASSSLYIPTLSSSRNMDTPRIRCGQKSGSPVVQSG